MKTTTRCTHTHSVRVDLDPEEQWVQAAEWRDGKGVLVYAVTASVEAGDPLLASSLVTLVGWYAKKDGTASAVRSRFPQRVKLGDLPVAVGEALAQAVMMARHG